MSSAPESPQDIGETNRKQRWLKKRSYVLHLLAMRIAECEATQPEHPLIENEASLAQYAFDWIASLEYDKE